MELVFNRETVSSNSFAFPPAGTPAACGGGGCIYPGGGGPYWGCGVLSKSPNLAINDNQTERICV